MTDARRRVGSAARCLVAGIVTAVALLVSGNLTTPDLVAVTAVTGVAAIASVWRLWG